jgi:hypothetical protein
VRRGYFLCGEVMAASTQRLQCTICRHPDVVQINWLIARGATVRPLAARFGVAQRPLYNHRDRHISKEFKAAVRVGPLASEAHLRDICDGNERSVLEQLRAINGAVSTRWLLAFEAGAHDRFIELTVQLRKNLQLIAECTREITPPPSVKVTNNFNLFQSPEYLQAVTSIADALRPYPEARRAVALAMKSLGASEGAPLIEAQPAA